MAFLDNDGNKVSAKEKAKELYRDLITGFSFDPEDYTEKEGVRLQEQLDKLKDRIFKIVKSK